MNKSKIIYPKRKHLYSFIMLHGMGSNIDNFNNFLTFFQCNIFFKHYYDSVKFIIPQSPTIDVHYPNNTIFNCNSWYDYYTQYDGVENIDEISEDDFQKSTQGILKIINKENKLINNKNIFLIGVSQGGTLIFNILKYLKFPIGKSFIIDSVYMYNYINLKKCQTPIIIISHFLDQIYTYDFQKYCLTYLTNNNISYNFLTIDHGYHAEESSEQFIYILNKIFIK